MPLAWACCVTVQLAAPEVAAQGDQRLPWKLIPCASWLPYIQPMPHTATTIATAVRRAMR